MNDIYGIDISPLQGSEIRATSLSQGVALCCNIMPFQGITIV